MRKRKIRFHGKNMDSIVNGALDEVIDAIDCYDRKDSGGVDLDMAFSEIKNSKIQDTLSLNRHIQRVYGVSYGQANYVIMLFSGKRG